MIIKEEQDLIPYQVSCLPATPYLVFAPHPDDETFGMGGTIALASQANHEVTVVVVTDGAAGGKATTRKNEAREAASILGIKKLLFLNLADRGISTNSSVITSFVKLIEKFDPKTIFLPSPLEFHPDHRVVTHVTLEAMKRTTSKSRIWFYEISRQSEANRFIDITSVLKIKQKAMKAYKSQLLQRPYDEYVLCLNRLRAYTLPQKIKYAEAFWKLTKDTDQKEVLDHVLNYIIAPDDKPRGVKRLLQSFLRR